MTDFSCLHDYHPETSTQLDLLLEFQQVAATGRLYRAELDHLTASGIIFNHDHSQVLLTLHHKAQRWFQTGGHIEITDPTLPAAAFREASEESGIPELKIDPVPVHLDAHWVNFCHPGENLRHLDVRFVLVAPQTATPVANYESTDLAWWPVTDLPTEDPSVTDLVAAGLTRLTAQPQ